MFVTTHVLFTCMQALTAQTVSTEAELRAAFGSAAPGSVITLADGTYTLSDKLETAQDGTAIQPITVRAAHLRRALIVSNGAEEAIHVVNGWWRFEGLHIQVSSNSTYGFKLEGNGHDAVISKDLIELEPGSEAGVKGAGGPTAPWPDNAVVEFTEIFFTAPTTYFLAEGLDAVAVHNWLIKNNVVHGIRTAANSVAYGLMTKGNCQGTIMEDNLLYDNFIHLSFGGGGTAPQWFRDGDSTYESRGGIMRNNVTLNSDDVAVYLYLANGAKVYNNTFFNSFMGCGTGCSTIDVRLAGSTADIRNNILDKVINDREGGAHTEGTNLTLATPTDGTWFVDAANRDMHLRPGTPPVDHGATLVDVPLDFDGHIRPAGPAYDVGAFELGSFAPPMDAGISSAADASRADVGSGMHSADAGMHPDGGSSNEPFRVFDPFEYVPERAVPPSTLSPKSEELGTPIIRRPEASGGCVCVPQGHRARSLATIALMAIALVLRAPRRASGPCPGSASGTSRGASRGPNRARGPSPS
jgi:hypothetical protein